jgi:hypothetical protein
MREVKPNNTTMTMHYINSRGMITIEELRSQLAEYPEHESSPCALGGFEYKFPDLVSKRKRSKPDGFGKVSLGKSKG